MNLSATARSDLGTNPSREIRSRMLRVMLFLMEKGRMSPWERRSSGT